MRTITVKNLAHLSGIIWLLSLAVFVGLIALELRNGNILSEQNSTVLVLIALTGIIAFLVSVILYVVHYLFLRKKTVLETADSRRNGVGFLLPLALLLLIGFVGVLVRGAYNLGQTSSLTEVKEISPEDVTYTGEEVLAELQKYRVKNNLPPFELSFDLCNGISERWQVYVDTDSHEGLDEFVDRKMPGMSVGEALTSGRTPQEAVDNLAGSPSHDLALKTYNQICVYTFKGHSVLLLSK